MSLSTLITFDPKSDVVRAASVLKTTPGSEGVSARVEWANVNAGADYRCYQNMGYLIFHSVLGWLEQRFANVVGKIKAVDVNPSLSAIPSQVKRDSPGISLEIARNGAAISNYCSGVSVPAHDVSAVVL